MTIFTAKKPIRLLFFAWGYSIHAERRINAFTGDDRFDVWLASTYDYENLPVKKILFREVYLQKRFETFSEFRKDQEQQKVSATERGQMDRLKLFVGVSLRAVHGILAKWHWFRVLLEWSIVVRDYGRLLREVGRIKPDVIFLQTLMYPSCLPLFLPRRCPLVITFWNGDVLFWAAFKGVERRLKKLIVTTGIKRASAITVNSTTMQAKVCELGGVAERIHLIRYPGVDRSRFFSGSREEARRRIGLKPGRMILCPRGLGGYLNSEVIVQAAAKVVTEFPDVLFVFVSGAGGDAEVIRHRRLAEELGVAERMVWAGQIPWPEMPDYYRASEALISISSQDSLPNCMLEGMACGIPLILGEIPQLKEWVEDGRNAFFVPPHDAETLAGKLNYLLSGDATTEVERHVAFNLKLVADFFDSQKNVEEVKQLVCLLADKQGLRTGT